MDATFVIPVWNDANVLKNCLKHLKEQDWPKARYEIMVVDDGSTDNTAAVAKKAGVRLIKKKHSGVPDTFNLGIKNARGKIIVLVDSDCYLSPGWLKAAMKKLDDGYAVVMGDVRYLKPSDHRPSTKRRIGKVLLSHIPFFDIDLPTFGEACAVRKEVFESVGLFSKEFQPIGGHDIDIALRAEVAGFRLGRSKDAWYFHDMTRLDLGPRVNLKKFVFYKHGEIRAYVKHIGWPNSRKLLANNIIGLALFPVLSVLRAATLRGWLF